MNQIFKPLFHQAKSQSSRVKDISYEDANGQVQRIKFSMQEIPGALSTIHCEEVNKNFDGLILLYDHPNKKSLQSVQRWLDKNQ